MKRVATVAMCLMVLSIVGSAVAADISECATIKDEAVRLFCYDRAAGRSSAASPAEVAPAPLDTTPAPTGEAPSPEPQPKPVWAPAPVKAPARIESRIVGPFSGWTQGTRFLLENGETWQALAITRFQAGRQDSPKVVIARDLIGQYQMSVDGVKPRVAVRLVEPAH